MSGFIEQFYYGNIEPQARGISANKTMAKELGVLIDAEEYLTSKLSGEEKKKFLDFVNATSVVNGETALDSFIVGFRLGAAFTLDTFVSNDTPFTNLLKEDIWIMGKSLFEQMGGTYTQVGDYFYNFIYIWPWCHTTL